MTSSVVYQRKCALIIGINDYQYDPLKYCINDAKDLNTTLQRIGFETTLKLNCNYNDFDRTINRFTETVQSNDLVFIYFAGHGKQMEDQNYLLPVDYDYDHRGYERDYIGDHAINVKYITKKIDKTKCRITIYIFDCCRQFVRTRAVHMKQGLLPMHAPLQTLIVFACGPGKSVLDETRNDRNGSFIENLLKHIETPNTDIEEIMRNVADAVYTETGGVQLPYRTSSFTKKVYLVTNNIQKASSSTARTNKELYSDKHIRCRGRACARCNLCRDWYWCVVNRMMRHTKRSDAICILENLGRYEDGIKNGDGDYHTVCECDDNRV